MSSTINKRITALEHSYSNATSLKPWKTYIHNFGEPLSKSIESNEHTWIITIVDLGNIDTAIDKKLSQPLLPNAQMTRSAY